MQVHGKNGDQHVDQHESSGDSSSETEHEKDSAKELGRDGEIGGPPRHAQVRNRLYEVARAAMYLLPPMCGHDQPQHKAQRQESKRLQLIQESHAYAPAPAAPAPTPSTSYAISRPRAPISFRNCTAGTSRSWRTAPRL